MNELIKATYDAITRMGSVKVKVLLNSVDMANYLNLFTKSVEITCDNAVPRGTIIVQQVKGRVECDHCRHWIKERRICTLNESRPDDFCSRGEH